MKQNPYSKIQPKIRKPYTEVYLIRHANPNYALQEKLGDRLMPLSVAGKKQSEIIAKRLRKIGIDVIYSSELARAQETADSFAGRKKILIEDRLNEIDWKRWHRVKYFRTSEDRRKQYLKNYDVLDAQLDKMQVEMRRVLADIFVKNKGRKVAVFCHGNIIKSLLTSIMNADVIGFLSLEIYQASISKLVIDRDGYVKISFINDVTHLPYAPTEDLFVTLLD